MSENNRELKAQIEATGQRLSQKRRREPPRRVRRIDLAEDGAAALDRVGERLAEVRNERRPNSRYASIENCRHEVAAAERMMPKLCRKAARSISA